jgi:hypothetical protein
MVRRMASVQVIKIEINNKCGYSSYKKKKSVLILRTAKSYKIIK